MQPRLFALVVSWVTASACAAPTEMADLAGTYVLSIQTDTLRLDSTGRYARTYAQPGTPRLVVIDSVRAMAFRSAAWLVIFGVLVWTGRRQELSK